ncbi:MJ1477/TM1410 family putative glycoside hydrolase [Deinococcus sp.]|uniref:MJ1477/TM1410 family putative glycoside hydrolase n=1 Tax=Deinococcus sp. TaxID=47478 RepID=UPI002869BEF6|nr:MJ1477/TM1410 family putative glycoside hydrolase [Deinococcus sp.]
MKKSTGSGKRLIRAALVSASVLTGCTSGKATGSDHSGAVNPGDGSHAPPGRGKGRAATLQDARSWVYQLQNYPNRLNDIAASRFQLAVVDYSADGSRPGKWTVHELKAAQQNKLMLAYLSIGEAESYRSYWESSWKPGTPSWLVRENPDWAGNYVVQYWQQDWQRVILGYLDEILAQGFDGVYLDIVDGYQNFPHRASARQDMTAWVCRLSAYAKSRVKDFLIVPQNAAELVQDNGYTRCIDGTGQEETFYQATNRATPQDERLARLRYYAEFLRLGKPVFSVDYVNTSDGVGEAYSQARALKLVEYAADVDLDALRINDGHDP